MSHYHVSRYQKDEIDDLANFLSVMEFHTLSRRAAHPYFLVDHFEDVTSPANVDMDIKCKRDIILFGYLRGCDIKKGTKVPFSATLTDEELAFYFHHQLAN